MIPRALLSGVAVAFVIVVTAVVLTRVGPCSGYNCVEFDDWGFSLTVAAFYGIPLALFGGLFVGLLVYLLGLPAQRPPRQPEK